METILGVHVELPKAISKNIRRFRHTSKNFVLASYPFTPHITIFLCRFPKRNFAKLMKRLTQLRLDATTLMIAGSRDALHAGTSTFLMLTIKKTAGLSALHTAVVQAASALRDHRLRKKDALRLLEQSLSRRNRTYLLRYGYFRVLKNFKPHITVGVFSNTLDSRQRSWLRHLKGTLFTPKHLVVGLYRYDERNGRSTSAVERKLLLAQHEARYDLKKMR